jgi:hypothetical protein
MSDMYNDSWAKMGSGYTTPGQDLVRLYNTGSGFGAVRQLMNGLLAELNQNFKSILPSSESLINRMNLLS